MPAPDGSHFTGINLIVLVPGCMQQAREAFNLHEPLDEIARNAVTTYTRNMEEMHATLVAARAARVDAAKLREAPDRA